MKHAFLTIFILSATLAQNTVDARVSTTVDSSTYNFLGYVGTASNGFTITGYTLGQPEYREYGLGIGQTLPFAVSDATITPILMGIKATDDIYIAPSLVALDTEGKVHVEIFASYFIPTSDDGIQQFLADPASVSYVTSEKTSIGINTYLWKASDLDLFYKIGPQFNYFASPALVLEISITTSDARDVSIDNTEGKLRVIFTF